MRKLAICVLAIAALILTGMTTVLRHPACANSPEQYESFVKALAAQDNFAVQFYLQTGCGFMRGDIPVTVLEEGDFWVKIRVEPEGHPPAVIYTSPGSIKE